MCKTACASNIHKLLKYISSFICMLLIAVESSSFSFDKHISFKKDNWVKSTVVSGHHSLIRSLMSCRSNIGSKGTRESRIRCAPQFKLFGATEKPDL